MAGSTSDDEDEITGINVTPLVDVMLVLLVIFMLTANYVVNRAIEVKLPSAETGDEKVTTLNMAFLLDKDSKLFLDGKPVSYDEIGEKIRGVIAIGEASAKNPQAMITADERTPHGAVVKLIDTVRKNGIKEFAINVEVPSTNGSKNE
ncbi:MAG: biopolymer transporter ExbD [Bdellovibrionota bacterium]